MPSTEVRILDCTIRDGGYLNSWRFEKKLTREIYRALSKAGVDYFEIGYTGTTKYFDRDAFGLWRFSDEKDIAGVCSNIHGAKIAIMADYGKFDLADLAPKAESMVTLFRLACHKDQMRDALTLLAKVKQKGYETSIQAMGYSGYGGHDRAEFVRMLADSDSDYAYVADSYGSIFPDQISGMIEPLLSLKPRMKIGFHPHNNLQMAFANSIEAVKSGADIIDSSIFGMGRGAGNLPTEIMLLYLQERIPDKFNVVPVLDCIDRYFINMQKDIGWGYQLIYMLTGVFKCHPTYAQKLINLKEYTMEDIWRALDCINKNNPVGYSEKLLNDIIGQGIIGCAERGPAGRVPVLAPAVQSGQVAPVVPYRDRHKERSFLILGNGPTLLKYKDRIQEFIDRYDPVVLGANYLSGMFKPHYHAFCNKRRFADYIDTVSAGSKLMIGQHIPEDMIREYTGLDHETIYYKDTISDFAITDGVIQSNCRSVSVLLLGVAIVMGADKVFAAGMDGYLNVDSTGKLLFYDEKDEKVDKDLILDMHRMNYKFIDQINEYLLRQGRDGIHILTPTSYSKFYKGITNYL
jgi:4-hydroxy 2-oxovalerate aldolase